jgi:GWxTD domain-containing protein
MNFTKYIIALLVLIAFNSEAQTKKLKAYLDEKQYFAPEIGNYIEIQLQYVGYTIAYTARENGLQGEIAVIMKFKQHDSIIASDAFRLQTPIMKDSIIEDFYDIKRFALKPGEYSFSIELKDLNSTEESLNATKNITIEDLSLKTCFSDIEIAESATQGDESSVFFKSGYNIIPKLSNYFPNELSFMPVYFEIYNTEKSSQDAFGIKQKITNSLTGEEIGMFTKTTRHKPASVVPFTRSIDIQNLPSGKYILEYTVINKEMVEVSKQSYEFERSSNIDNIFDPEKIILNPAFQESIHKDSVQFYLASLIPMAKPAEIKNILTIIKTKNEANARKLIQGFWIATSGTNAYDSWLKYKEQVVYVEHLYKNNYQAGYETDRGRVYLQYGAPTSVIQRETTSNEYPYEIWQYNKIGKYSNRRFIFYNPDLVSTSYRLLHSDMIGEMKNPSWQQVLTSRNTPHGNIDTPNQNVNSTFGDSDYYFKQY